MNIKLEDNKIILEILADVVFKNRESDDAIPLRVINVDKMTQWINNDGHSQLELEMCINQILLNAYEHAEAWIEGIIVDKTNMEERS